MALNARLVMQDSPQAKRATRRPQHHFTLKTPPWVIQPFLMAPVLPGETLQNAILQSRVVTDPVKNPLIGWWKEYYFFYVKHRDLYERDELVNMVLDPEWDVSVVTTAQGGTAAKINQYYAGGAGMINWTELCLRRIIDEFFRDEGSTYADADTRVSIDGFDYPLVSINNDSWLDSVRTNGAQMFDDVDVDGADANTTVQASEVEYAMRQWEMLRMANLTQMSYEDFLQTYGVRAAATELHRPELIRYIRDWTYPSNTIDPTNGTARSALSWTVTERIDKQRFFTEPGFIVGLTCTRPKVYRSKQAGAAVEVMNDIFTWLPNIISSPRASFKKVADAVGPLGAINGDTGGYWLDVKDIFMHGDQFVNFAFGGAAPAFANEVDVPDLNLLPSKKRYVQTSGEITALFTTPASAYHVREDGVVNLSILSSVRDTSPRGTGQSILS